MPSRNGRGQRAAANSLGFFLTCSVCRSYPLERGDLRTPHSCFSCVPSLGLALGPSTVPLHHFSCSRVHREPQ